MKSPDKATNAWNAIMSSNPYFLHFLKSAILVPLNGRQMLRYERGNVHFMSAGLWAILPVSETEQNGGTVLQGIFWACCHLVPILGTLHPDIINLTGHWQASLQYAVFSSSSI